MKAFLVNAYQPQEKTFETVFKSWSPHGNIGKLLKSYIDFGYVILLVPFRLTKVDDGDNNGRTQGLQHSVNSSTVHQVACAIVHVLVIFQYFNEARSFNMQRLQMTRRPGYYLEFFTGWMDFLYKIVAVKCFWAHTKRVTKLMSFIDSHQSMQIFSHTTWITSKIAVVMVCLTLTTMALVSFFLSVNAVGIEYIVASIDWTIRRYVATARFNFFLSSSNALESAPEYEDMSPLDYILAVVTFVSIAFRQFMAFYADGFILVGCLVLWTPTRAFASLIKRDLKTSRNRMRNNVPSSSLSVQLHNSTPSNFLYNVGVYDWEFEDENGVMKSYTALKELARLVNRVISEMILLDVCQTICHFSINMGDIFVSCSPFAVVRKTFFTLLFLLTLYLGGDIAQRLLVMGDWISTKFQGNLAFGQREKLAWIAHEVKSQVVGLSGHLFILNYSAIFKILATMFTYFIIFTSSQEEVQKNCSSN